MKFLRGMLDKVEPMFLEGGKLERLYPLYEAADTFLYTPPDRAKGLTHVRDGLDLKRTMIFVVLSLIPCIYMALWNTGYQANLQIAAGAQPTADWHETLFEMTGLAHDPSSWISNIVLGTIFFLPVYIVTMSVGGTIELIFSIVRKHEINEGFLVSGMLFPLILPPTIPLWQVAVGIGFGILVGKEVFGGTGKNFLNPALTARAFLYFAYATDITGEKVWTAVSPDGFSGATTLGVAASSPTGTTMAEAVQQVDAHGITWMGAFMGWIQGSMGETSTFACLLGAAFLIATGIGSWRIMAGCVIGAMGLSGIFMLASSDVLLGMPPWWHLVIGGFAFGTVFMATDPVSAAMTRTGKWFYGILIGVVTILIRVVSPAFPEGIMLAILFGNVMAPLIDYFVLQANINRRKARYAT
ncbi:NADH:ubiquinone reductase (Na(+)-transporting) subunit B [Bremerella sp. T1]|uniref:NADH:ubiquinone reductase (Na(+)-transporting) subunit B n=1 Tax=Bremerella sp. TYQ1 TaxID=3119568 RepID=UPI001CCA3305|nr:NADH:ubiquinone reductase (Na(+)-transporting) subunit B [Bremerella volcania]UBM33716.1 NADH:ubiquinone reductase (Na(+)-transporting) subunit B [Bremerella volcania]